MNPSILPTILPSTLDEAQVILRNMAIRWPAQQISVSSSKPLWQSALEQVDPEWAEVFGASINWIDEVPLVLMSASRSIASEKAVEEYTAIASSLDGLLKEVSNPTQKWYQFPVKVSTSITPADRLEVLMSDKKKLDEDSLTRMGAMQNALDLGDDARHLAAMMSDAIPFLRARIKEHRATLDIEKAPTMTEAQWQARLMKSMDRADSALDLVASRIENETAPSAVLNRDGLERMVGEEQRLHARMNTLSNQIAKTIAGDQVNTQSTQQGARLAMIAIAHDSAPALPILASVAAPPAKRPGFLSRLFGRTPQQALADVSTLSSSTDSLSAQPPVQLSEHTKELLKNIDQKYVGYPSLSWRDLRLVLKDPDVCASTLMPTTGKTLLGRFITPTMWVSGEYASDSISMIEELVARKADIRKELCDWNLLAMVCVGEMESSHSRESEVWAALRIVARFGHLMDMTHHTAILSEFALSAARRIKEPSPNYAALTKVFDTMLTPDAIKSTSEQAWVRHYDLDAANISGFCKDIKNPAIASSLAFCLIKNSELSTRSPQKEKELMEFLSPADRQDLIQHLLASESTTTLRARTKNLLSTSTMMADLAAPPTPETQWAFALKEWASVIDEGKTSLVPANVLACGLSMRSLPLVARIANICPLPLFKSDLLQVDGSSQAPLSIIMDLDMAAKGLLKNSLSPTYWCALFKHQINRFTSQEYKYPPGVHTRIISVDVADGIIRQPTTRKLEMTPLMQAAYQGDFPWMHALLDSGADPAIDFDGYDAIAMLRTHVIKKVMLHESQPMDLAQAPRKTQDVFIRKMVHAMDESRLWDIEKCSPSGCIERMLITAMTTDMVSPQLSSSAARRQGIEKCIKSLGASQFIETIASAVEPRGNLQVEGSEVSCFLQHGIAAGVFVDSPSGMEKVIDEIKQRVSQPVATATDPPRRRSMSARIMKI